MDIGDSYRLLGLRAGASYAEVKSAYRQLARKYHPDANPDRPLQAKEKFIQLTGAYKQLVSLLPPDVAEVNLTADRDRTPPVSPPVRPQPPPFQTAPNTPVLEQRLKHQAYSQLQQFLRERRLPRAIALVEGLAQRLPEDAEIRQWQAITYQRFGQQLIEAQQYEKAKLYLKKALRTDPQNRSLWQAVERDMRRMAEVLL